MLRTVLTLITFLLPTQLGLHLWPSWSFLHGLSIDYLSITVYFTDLLLLTLLFIHPPRFLFNKSVKIVVSTILLSSFLGLQPLNSLVLLFRIFLLLNFSHAVSTQNKTTLSSLLTSISASTILISLLAIFQFISQSSLDGPFYWLGERHYSLTTPDIAKTILPLTNQQVLRSYSTFSHPNSLAGYLVVVSLLIIILKRKLNLKNVLIQITLLLSFLALLTTFSRSAIFALIVSVISLFFSISYSLSLVILIPLLLTLILTVPLSLGSQVSVTTRQLLNLHALKATWSHLFFGLGLNNFTIYLSQITPPLNHYLLQPVHNIYLLLLSELGVVPIITFLFIKPHRKINSFFLPVILTILITGSLDHYWLTLPQNRLLISFFVGLLFNSNLSRHSS